jgi:hypothetical protein
MVPFGNVSNSRDPYGIHRLLDENINSFIP